MTGYLSFNHFIYKAPSAAAKFFISSLAEQNWDQVEKIASGQALYTINTRKKQVGSLYAAKIVDLNINVIAASKEWALAKVVAETKLSNEDIDVLWYDLRLENDGGWKVYQVTPTLPELVGTPDLNRVSTANIKGIKAVFSDYLTSLTQNRYEEAGRYLVGIARQQFEIDKPVLGNSPVINEFEGIKVEPVWNKGNMVVSKMSYKADSRPVSVMVWMYNTSDGWKIVNVESA